MLILAYPFIFIFLINVINCDTWRDPYNTFEIFKDKNDPDELSADLNSVSSRNQSKNKCPEAQLTVDCFAMLSNLLMSINNQLPLEFDDKSHEITLNLVLSGRDIERIRLLTPPSKMQPTLLCSVIQDSLSRPHTQNIFSRLSKFTLSTLSSIRGALSNATFRVNHLFQFKEFMAVLIFLTFLASVYILFIFRSILLMIIWILLCMVFVTMYTSYLHLYEKGIAEKEAVIARLGVKLPAHCHHSTRGFWNSFYGTKECEEYFLALNVRPEVEIKLSAILIDIVSSVWTGTVLNMFESSFAAADRITDNLFFPIRYVMKPIVSLLALIFFIICILLFTGFEFSLFGVRFAIGQRHRIPQPAHREFIEHVPPPATVVRSENVAQHTITADFLHNLLELREKSAADKVLKHGNPSIQTSVGPAGHTQKNLREHDKPLHRLKSTGILRTTKELVPVQTRRKSL